MMKGLGLSLIFIMLGLNLGAQELSVNIKGLRNDVGVVRLAFFTDNESFQKEMPLISKTVSKNNIHHNNLKVVLTGIPPGKYGIALLDDENEDGEMAYNFFGIPKEGFGFSNHYHRGFSKPDFETFSFNFYDDKTIEIRVRYIY